MSPAQRPEEDVITAEKATYSSLTLHRRCPQAWKYRYIDGLRRARSEVTPALDFGSWFHAVRALDRINKGTVEGTLKAHPEEIQTTDTGPTFPWDASPSDVLAAAVEYWDRLAGGARGGGGRPGVEGAEDGTWRSERVAVEVAHPHCGMTWMSFALSTDTPVRSPEPPTCHSPAPLAS